MPEKIRLTISLPEHIADEITRRSKSLHSNPTEYATDVIRWWFGEGSPPITPEEKRIIATSKPTKEKKAHSTPTT